MEVPRGSPFPFNFVQETGETAVLLPLRLAWEGLCGRGIGNRPNQLGGSLASVATWRRREVSPEKCWRPEVGEAKGLLHRLCFGHSGFHSRHW